MPSTQYHDATFGVRVIAARTDAAGVDVPDLPLDEDRMANAFTEGYLTWQACQVQADSPTSMTVVVGSGDAKADRYVVEGDDDGQHPYIVRLDDATVDVALDASDASNPRVDEVWLVVADQLYDGGSVSLPRIAVRKGDPASSPAAPGPDSSWKAAARLASITVAAGVTSIGDADITDQRKESVHLHGVPVGTIWLTAENGTPTGWLECNGAAVSRTTYARLFAKIGTTYGVGDGSTTFNVPDLAGTFPVGVGTLGSNTYALGDTGGEAEHALTTAEMPSHTHTGPSHSHGDGSLSASSNGSHSHDMDRHFANDTTHHHGAGATGAPFSSRSSASGSTVNESSAVDSGGSHTHDVTGTTAASGTGNTGSAGSGDAHENRPPYLGVRFIIYAAA